MKAVLRHIHSPDTSDLRAYAPPSSAFAVLIQLMIGPSDGPGEESFDVVVCSPAWLAEQASPIVGRHHLIVQQYDYGELERFVVDYLEQCDAENWQGVAEKVGRLGRWEFEDYQE